MIKNSIVVDILAEHKGAAEKAFSGPYKGNEFL
jgi:hypothetical protein